MVWEWRGVYVLLGGEWKGVEWSLCITRSGVWSGSGVESYVLLHRSGVWSVSGVFVLLV